MSTQLVPAGQYRAHRRIWRRSVQTARLCCGIPDYDNYVRHMLEKHPDQSQWTTRRSSANAVKRATVGAMVAAAVEGWVPGLQPGARRGNCNCNGESVGSGFP